MGTVVTAIYEEGVLRPLTPVRLPEKAQVWVYILEDAESWLAQSVDRVLLAAGLTKPRLDSPASTQLISDARRSELAHRYAADKLLSDLVIEDRQE